MKLSFLKSKRWPRVAPQQPDEKSIGLSPDDALSDHCVSELMDAVADKNVMKFRQAVEALVTAMFEEDETDDEQ